MFIFFFFSALSVSSVVSLFDPAEGWTEAFLCFSELTFGCGASDSESLSIPLFALVTNRFVFP